MAPTLLEVFPTESQIVAFCRKGEIGMTVINLWRTCMSQLLLCSLWGPAGFSETHRSSDNPLCGPAVSMFWCYNTILLTKITYHDSALSWICFNFIKHNCFISGFTGILCFSGKEKYETSLKGRLILLLDGVIPINYITIKSIITETRKDFIGRWFED